MKKKIKRSIVSYHKEIEHNGVGSTITGNEVMLADGSKYTIQKDGSWRKKE